MSDSATKRNELLVKNYKKPSLNESSLKRSLKKFFSVSGESCSTCVAIDNSLAARNLALLEESPTAYYQQVAELLGDTNPKINGKSVTNWTPQDFKDWQHWKIEDEFLAGEFQENMVNLWGERLTKAQGDVANATAAAEVETSASSIVARESAATEAASAQAGKATAESLAELLPSSRDFSWKKDTFMEELSKAEEEAHRNYLDNIKSGPRALRKAIENGSSKAGLASNAKTVGKMARAQDPGAIQTLANGRVTMDKTADVRVSFGAPKSLVQFGEGEGGKPLTGFGPDWSSSNPPDGTRPPKDWSSQVTDDHGYGKKKSFSNIIGPATWCSLNPEISEPNVSTTTNNSNITLCDGSIIPY